MKFEIDINREYEEIQVVIKAPQMSSDITDIMTKLQTKKANVISGTMEQKIYILNIEDVLLFYSQKGRIFADTLTHTYEIKLKLYEVEEELIGASFVRISQSAIVNIRRIKNIEVSFNGSLVVKFANSHEEIISRRFVARVKEFIGLGGKA